MVSAVCVGEVAPVFPESDGTGACGVARLCEESGSFVWGDEPVGGRLQVGLEEGLEFPLGVAGRAASVNPARAGMIRTRRGPLSRCLRKPRASGDDP